MCGHLKLFQKKIFLFLMCASVYQVSNKKNVSYILALQAETSHKNNVIILVSVNKSLALSILK